MPIISEKGWIVIPEEMRRRHGLKKGDRVRLIDYGGVLSIVPQPSDSIAATGGMSKGKRSLVKALLASRKEDASRGK